MTLFFIHVTKTAGGTIKRKLRDAAVGRVQFHYPGEANYSRDFAYAESTDVVYGHYRFGAHEQMGQAPRYACFVREPLARTISHFHHLKNVAKTAAGEEAREHGTIEAFLANSQALDLDNLQTRMLSGIGQTAGFDGLDEDAVTRAVENLRRHFEYIGVFEHLHESVARLKTRLPGLDDELPHVNKGRYDEDLTPEVRDAVAARNQLDLRVYDEAVKLAGY